VLDIVYSSAAVPIIFTPLFIHDKCLIDGGIFTNSPIKQCVNNEGLCNEILSIIPNKNKYNNIVNDCTLLDYIIFLLDNLITIVNNENTITTKLQYYTDIVPVSINHIMDIISSKEKRSALIEKGCNIVSSSL
jgi:predicted acylesterase/phospholipase RssA